MEGPYERCATCNHARTRHMKEKILGGTYAKRCTIANCDCKDFIEKF